MTISFSTYFVFLIQPTNKFGEKLKDQVENRLKFLKEGVPTESNDDVMNEVLEELKEEGLYADSKAKLKKILRLKKKKAKAAAMEIEEEDAEEEKPKKKKKKSKE